MPKIKRSALASAGFNPNDAATWPAALTLEQVAAIYQRTLSAVRSAVARKSFVPAPKSSPFKKKTYLRPLTWNRTDVVRDLEIDLRRAS